MNLVLEKGKGKFDACLGEEMEGGM